MHISTPQPPNMNATRRHGDANICCSCACWIVAICCMYVLYVRGARRRQMWLFMAWGPSGDGRKQSRFSLGSFYFYSKLHCNGFSFANATFFFFFCFVRIKKPTTTPTRPCVTHLRSLHPPALIFMSSLCRQWHSGLRVDVNDSLCFSAQSLK